MLRFPPSKCGISQPGSSDQEFSAAETPPQACRICFINKNNTALNLMSQSIPRQAKAGSLVHSEKRDMVIFFPASHVCLTLEKS